MPKPFWPLCAIRSPTKAVRLISCHSRASPKPRSERKNSPDHQKARGDGRFAGAKCCSAARSSRPISNITPVYSITSAGVTSNADGTFRPKSWRSCLEGLACRKSVPSWLRGTIVHLQRAGLTMKTILVPTQNTPTMQSTLETAVLLAQRTGAYIEGVPRRSACLESATSRNIFIISPSAKRTAPQSPRAPLQLPTSLSRRRAREAPRCDSQSTRQPYPPMRL